MFFVSDKDNAYSLKKHRINSKLMFQNIFENGNKVFYKNLVFRFLKSEDGEFRTAYIIPKRVGKAVHRNRIRRILRSEIVGLRNSLNTPYWIIIHVREQKGEFSSPKLHSDAQKLFQKSEIVA